MRSRALFRRRAGESASSWPLVARVAVSALMPSLLTVSLAALLWRGTPLDFVPLWSDEVIYWNEAAAFMRAGFDAGYITVTEAPARAGFSHFGPHGVGYAVLYGSLAKVTGWTAASPYLMHLVVVPLCAAVWFWRRRRQPGRVAETLLVATFWPLLLYLPTGMTEPLHFGIALLFAALLEPEQPTRRNRIARIVLFAVAVVLRPTWTFVLPALLYHRLTSWRRWVAVAAATATIAIASFGLQSWMSAPYGQAWLLHSAGINLSWPGLVLARMWAGVQMFVTPHEQWFITVYRFETVAGLLALAVLWWRGDAAARKRLERAGLVLLPVLALQLALADVESGRDLRIVTSHALAALLLVAGTSRRRAAMAAVASVALLPLLFTSYTTLHDGRFTRAQEARDFGDAARDALAFDESAPSPWDNTLLVHADALTPAVIGTPPGVGISYVLDWEDMPSRPRSRYVLLRPRDQGAYSTEGMQLVAQLPAGTLYRRIGSDTVAQSLPTK